MAKQLAQIAEAILYVIINEESEIGTKEAERWEGGWPS